MPNNPGPYGSTLPAVHPDTFQRPPVPIPGLTPPVPAANKPLPGETQAAYNTRVGTTDNNVSSFGPYGADLLARDPENFERPPVPEKVRADGHETDLAFNRRTGRLPLPGETDAAYKARVSTPPTRN
jgi:hypothetical protein